MGVQGQGTNAPLDPLIAWVGYTRKPAPCPWPALRLARELVLSFCTLATWRLPGLTPPPPTCPAFPTDLQRTSWWVECWRI